MKLRDLVWSENALSVLMNKEMTPIAAFRLALFIRKIGPVLEEFRRQQEAVALKYGERKEDNSIDIPEDQVPSFKAELDPILNEEIGAEIPYIKPSDIVSPITPSEMLALDWMLQGEEK